MRQLLWDDTLCAWPAFDAGSQHDQMRENLHVNKIKYAQMPYMCKYGWLDKQKHKIHVVMVWPNVFLESYHKYQFESFSSQNDLLFQHFNPHTSVIIRE